MKNTKQKRITRNVLHDHPLMKKGGVHEKTEKAKRQRDKQQLRKSWRNLKVNSGLFSNYAMSKGLSVSEGNWITSLA